MLTAEKIALIQSALDNLALLTPKQISNPIRTPRPFDVLAIDCRWCDRQIRQTVNHRGFVEKVVPSNFYCECRIATLDVWATGPTRIAAIRNCLKALRNAAALNAPTLVVPLSLCEPRKAARAAKADRFADALDRAATARDAERDATT